MKRKGQKKGTKPKQTCPGRGMGCTLDRGHAGKCVPQRAWEPAE